MPLANNQCARMFNSFCLLFMEDCAERSTYKICMYEGKIDGKRLGYVDVYFLIVCVCSHLLLKQSSVRNSRTIIMFIQLKKRMPKDESRPTHQINTFLILHNVLACETLQK